MYAIVIVNRCNKVFGVRLSAGDFPAVTCYSLVYDFPRVTFESECARPDPTPTYISPYPILARPDPDPAL